MPIWSKNIFFSTMADRNYQWRSPNPLCQMWTKKAQERACSGFTMAYSFWRDLLLSFEQHDVRLRKTHVIVQHDQSVTRVGQDVGGEGTGTHTPLIVHDATRLAAEPRERHGQGGSGEKYRNHNMGRHLAQTLICGLKLWYQRKSKTAWVQTAKLWLQSFIKTLISKLFC